jgi:hypothetical protein
MCKHEWVVFSKALSEGWLMLQCVHSLAHATVDDPSEGEWEDAHGAPSKPYRWEDESRLTLHPEKSTDAYVAIDPSGGYRPAGRWRRMQEEKLGKRIDE